MRTASAANCAGAGDRLSKTVNPRPYLARSSSSLEVRSRACATLPPLHWAARQAEPTSARTHERIRPRSRTLNRTQAERPSAVPHASRCLIQKSIPAPQSPSAGQEPGWRPADFRVTTWGGRAQSLVFGVLPSGLCGPTRISLSKHERPRTRCPRLSPRRACGFRPGGERQQMPTTTRPGRVMRRAKPLPRKSIAPEIKRPIACRSAPAATRPRSSAFAPPAWCPA